MRCDIRLAAAFALTLVALLACSGLPAAPTPTLKPAAETPAPPTVTSEPEASLVPIDATWSEYVSPRLGFSIRVPNAAYFGNGDCVWTEADGDHSYRPVMAEVPVAVFEDVDRVYITAAAYTELTLPTEEPAGAGVRTFFAGCEPITNSLELVRTQESIIPVWEIVIREIGSDADLESLIDEVYGEACRLEGTTESDTPGVLCVQMQGDGLPPETTACWLNFMYVFLYDPALQRAATWGSGQSIYFIRETTTYAGYDAEMIESFRFLP